MENDRQLFVIGKDILSSVDFLDLRSTCKAMAQLNMLHAPFKVFDVNLAASMHDVFRFLKYEGEGFYENDVDEPFPFVFRYEEAENDSIKMFLAPKGKEKTGFIPLQEAVRKTIEDPECPPEFWDLGKDMLELQADIYFAIIALLATKNADKETVEVKKHGPKSRKRPKFYRYITTIKIGKITETMHGDGESRGPVRPHLRRGHIRNQRIGEGRKETKQIFIQPVFVNADEKWIENQRQEYRVKI